LGRSRVPHRIDAAFGRIFVGICYESYLCQLEREFAAANERYQPLALKEPADEDAVDAYLYEKLPEGWR
jgi:hypothetical protein